MSTKIQHFYFPRFACLAAASIFLAPALQAQESIRPSLTGSTASEARREATRPAFRHNVKAGPVLLDLRGGVEFEFNDNVNLSDSNREEDLIIRPSLFLSSFWRATELNALQLDVGFSYAKYINNQSLDTNSVLIAPGSQLSFDVFVGDFRINFHDRLSILQDPLDEVTLSNEADFTRLQNTAGVSVLWDLNDIKVVLGYDHYNFKSISGSFDILDRSEEQFTTSVGFEFNDTTTAGIDAGASLIDYEEDFNNDGVSVHAGPFLEMQLSNYLKLRLAAGFQAIDFDSGGTNGDDSDASGPYGSATFAHRLNNYITHSLSVGYETRLGLQTNSVDLAFARYLASWRINRPITLNFDAFAEDARESDGLVSEDAQRVGTGVGFDYQLTRKLTVGVRYQFTVKDSDLEERDYYQNRAALNFSYDF